MKNMKIENIYIVIYIFLFIIVPITCIDAIFPIAFDIIKLISVSSMSIYLLIQFIKEKKLDKFDIIMIINSIALIIISAITQTITLKNTFAMLSIAVITIFFKKSLSKSNASIKALYYLYVTIVILNVITIFFRMKVNGVDFFFIGGKNAISLTIIPAMLIIYMYSLLKYNKLTYFNMGMLILCFVSLIVSKSTTAIIVAIVLVCKLLASFLKLKISFAQYAITYIVISVLIIFGLPYITNTPLNDAFQKVFNKNLTFTHRTELWQESYERFLDSPIIGYGKNNDIIQKYTKGDLDQCHNMLLEAMLTGGSIALLLLIMAFIISANKLDKNNKTDRVMLFYLFLYAIIGLVESITYIYQLWMMLAIAYTLKDISKNNQLIIQENKELEDKEDVKENIK